MKTPDCADFELLMPDALTGRLRPSGAAVLEAHLAECDACRASYEECSRAAAALEAAFPPGRGQTARLWSRVAESLETQPAPAVRAYWPRRALWAAAAMVAVAAFVYLVAHFASPTSAPAPVPATSEVATDTAGGSPLSVAPPVTPRPEPTVAAQHPAPEPAQPAEGPPLPTGTRPDVADLPTPETPQEPGKTVEHLSPAPVAVAPRPERLEAVARPARESIDDTLGLAVTRKAGLLVVFDPQHRAWRGVVSGERIPYGWKSRTGAGGRAELAFGESRIRVDESTTLSVERAAGGKRVVHLSGGRLRVDLLRSEAGFRICSGGGVVELTGTIVEVDAPAADVAFVRVLEGHADVTAKAAAGATPVRASVAAGQEMLLACAATEQALRILPEAVRARALALAQKAGLVLPFENTAAWDEELDRPRHKSSAAVGQLIVRDEQGREAEPLAIEDMNVRVSIRGPEALTRIEQVFLNQTARTLEGTFYFPLPPGAAISRYAMYVDDKTLVEGEVVERGMARQIFESILRAKRDPALLEWMEGNLFKTRIFPIAPHGRKRLILEYTELLPAFFDTRRYVLPLVSELTQKTGIGRLYINVDLETNDASSFTELVSPSYAKETRVAGVGSPHATAALSLAACKPGADFVLSFSAPRPAELFSAAYGEAGEPPYVLLGYQPRPAPERLSGATPGGRDVLFVVETSGARTPQDLDAQARVLQTMAAALALEGDRLAVAAADTGFVPYLKTFLPAHGDEARAALAAVAQRAPLGALDLGAAVRGAAEFLDRNAAAGRQRVAVFIGAGMPAYGVLDAGRLARDGAAELAQAKASFIAVGVGRAVDALVLSELARRAGGFYRPLRVDEGLDEAAFLLALGLQTPLLSAPVLVHNGTLCDVYPEDLGALLPGQEVFLHARANPVLPGKLSVKGILAGEEYARQFAPAWPAALDADPAVGRFWARAKLDGMLAQPQTRELRGQVIDLAQTWTLMSPYTSFLVLESEADYKRFGIDRRKRRALWHESRPDAAPPVEQSDAQSLLLGRKIAIMVNQGKALFETGKYDAAVGLANKILELDPTNAEAHSIIATARERRHTERKKQIDEDYKENSTLARERAERMNIPHNEYLVYPESWREIAQRRDDQAKGKTEPQRPAGGDATQAEIDRLKKDIETLRGQLQGSSAAMPKNSVESAMAGRYGPGATVMTKSGELAVGGLLQVWFYAFQQESPELFGKAQEGQHQGLAPNTFADYYQSASEVSHKPISVQGYYLSQGNALSDKMPDLWNSSANVTDFPGPRIDKDWNLNFVFSPPSIEKPAAETDVALLTRRLEMLRQRGLPVELNLPHNATLNEMLAIQTKRLEDLVRQGVPVYGLLREDQADETNSSWEDVELASIDYGRQLLYPLTWDQISRRVETEAIGKQVKEEAWKAEIRKKLQRKVTFEFVDTPLDEAIKQLASSTGTSLTLVPKVIAEGANKTPVTIRVQDMEVELALKWILRLADLEYGWRDEGVFITKKTNTTANTELQIYDVRDLNAEAVAGLIRKQIAPDSWDKAASIETGGGKLVVMQTAEAHAAIARTLKELRAQKALNGPAPQPADTKCGTVAVELTREQVAQLLEMNPPKPGNEDVRAELLRKLAGLTDGVAGYRVLADGIAEFDAAGPHAEALARDLLIRVARETEEKTLEATLEFVKDASLRGGVLARQAMLEPDVAKRAKLWERAYAESEKDPSYLKPLCDALRAAGQNKALIERLEAALRQGLSQPWMWQSLTEACAACGDQAGSLRALTQAVALRPREAEPRRQLALALKNSGRAADAIAQLRAACEFSPDGIALHRELLALARSQGDNEAREWVLLAMLGRDWQPADGDVLAEANRELRALRSEYERAGQADKAKELQRKQAVANAMDVVIVMTWDTDQTDVDLHVAEPHAQVNYHSKRSFQGGTLDRDVTTGYGPETYTLRHGAPGEYMVKVHYFSGDKPTKVDVKATFKKGSPEERTETHTVELKRENQEVEVFRFNL